MFFHLLRLHRLVLRLCVLSSMHLSEKKEDIAQAEERLMKEMQGSEQLEMSNLRRCVEVFFVQFKKGICEENGTVLEERSLLQSLVAVVQGYYARESAEIITLFRQEVEKQEMRDSLGYDLKWKDKSYVEGTVTSTTYLSV